MLASNKTIHVQIVSSIVFVLFLIGCVYIPGGRFSEETLATLKVGTTTKEETLQLLGEPIILKDKKFFIYERERGFGTIIVFPVGYGGGGLIPLKSKNYRILLEFNENEVVERCEIEGGTYKTNMGAIPDRKLNAPLAHIQTVFEDRRIFDSVAFSPNGKMLAAGDLKNCVWLEDLQTGKEVKFKGKKHFPNIKSVEFSPDNKTLAAGGVDKIAKVWDVATGKEVVAFEGHGKSSPWATRLVTSLAFSPDGKTIATGGWQGKVILWNSKTGHEIMTIKAHKLIVNSIAFSPEGNLLVTTGSPYSNVKLWNLSTGKELATLSLHNIFTRNSAATFSPDGSLLAIATKRHIELWNIATKRPIGESGSWDPIGELSAAFILPYFKPDNNLNVATSVAFSHDGQMVAACYGGAAIWDLNTSQRLWRSVPLKEYEDVVYDLAFSPDGKTFAVAFEDSVRLYDAPQLANVSN